MEPALLSLDIAPMTLADREKLAHGLQMLAAEDFNLQVRADVERDCTVIGATTDAHLEEIIDRLKREFEVEASGRSRSTTDPAAVPLGREVPPESWVASIQGVAPSGVARVHVAVRL